MAGCDRVGGWGALHIPDGVNRKSVERARFQIAWVSERERKTRKRVKYWRRDGACFECFYENHVSSGWR